MFCVQYFSRISPPAWGWPVGDIVFASLSIDFPTRVGMARCLAPARSCAPRFPHPRGDGPCPDRGGGGQHRISPPAWGWPAVRTGGVAIWTDFPTRVGMARCSRRRSRSRTRFPHPRGDGPTRGLPVEDVWRISPPAWGWPGFVGFVAKDALDFPTRVGMAREITCGDSSAA